LAGRAGSGASRSSELRMRAHPGNPMPPGISLPGYRAALDPDDYRCGFGVWSSTSFSAPLLAAEIVRSLPKGAAESGLRLAPFDAQAMTNRVLAALNGAAALGMPIGSIGPTRGRCLAKLRALLASGPAGSPR
jgi:hypothetical protein